MKKFVLLASLWLLTGTAWAGGKTIWFSSYAIAGNTGANIYLNPCSAVGSSTTEVNRSPTIPTNGAVSNLYVSSSAAPGAGKSWDITVKINGSSTDCPTCQISGASATTCSSSTSKTVSAGDTVTVWIDPTSTPAAANISVTLQFTATADKETAWLASATANLNTSGTSYFGVAGDSGPYSDETYKTTIVPFAGTITKFYAKLTTAAPGDGSSRTFKLCKNGSVEGAPSITISNTATTGSDTATSLGVSAGDTLTIQSTVSDTPANSYAVWGVCIEATTNGQFGIPMPISGNLSTSADRYLPIGGAGIAPDDTETDVQNYFASAETVELKGLYAKTRVAPGSGKSYVIHLRDNAGDASPDLDVTIADTATTGSSSETLTPTSGHFLNYIIHPSGTPAESQISASLLGYIAPGSTSQNNLLLGVGP